MQTAGWYPDPGDTRLLRYWDGGAWTPYTQPQADHRGPVTNPNTFPPPGYPPSGYPVGQPMVAAKNPAVSLLVSFFLPGVGSMINGDVGKGVVILLIWLVSIPLTFFIIGFFTLLGAFIWGLVDAYQGARRWNSRHGIIS